MRTCIYRRVSTDLQAEEGFSLEAQRQRLEAYATSQGWSIVADYCDEGFSAKNTDRPQMQKLIADVKEKKFDVVLVYRLDRFVRSVLDLHELLQIMDKHDVRFKSATEVFDTTSATGRLFITMIATLAQWERETIAERVHMGMTKKSEQGQRNGAPAPFGYDLIEGNLIVNDESKWVKYIFDRYNSIGGTNIAKELNRKGIKTKKGEVWSDYSVRYVIRNPIYKGMVRWNYETTAKGKRTKTNEEITVEYMQKDFQPIISAEQFDHAQQLLKKRSVQAFRSDNFYPFTGILKCGQCGYPYAGAFRQMKNKIHRFYKCKGRFSLGICDSQAIAEDAIENEVLKRIQMYDTLIHVKDDVDKDDLNKQLTQLNRRKERTEELYIDGDIRKDRYTKMMQSIKEEETKIINELSSASDNKDIRLILKNILEYWHEFTFEEKKEAMQSLFKSITIKIVEKAVPKQKKVVIQITDYELL
jgi:site-specific DNA recombinase